MALVLAPAVVELLQMATAACIAWYGGKTLAALGEGVMQHMSEQSSSSPAEQSQNADNAAQNLSPGDPKEPCEECRNDENRKKKAKKRTVSEDEIKGKSYDRAEHYLDKELRDNADWTKDSHPRWKRRKVF